MKFFVRIILWLGLGCLLAWLLSIEPLNEYGWFMGIIHGALAPFNWVISWFNDFWFVKAPLHTTAYNVFWWISLVLTVIGIPGRLFGSSNNKE